MKRAYDKNKQRKICVHTEVNLNIIFVFLSNHRPKICKCRPNYKLINTLRMTCNKTTWKLYIYNYGASVKKVVTTFSQCWKTLMNDTHKTFVCWMIECGRYVWHSLIWSDWVFVHVHLLWMNQIHVNIFLYGRIQASLLIHCQIAVDSKTRLRTFHEDRLLNAYDESA